MLKMRQEAPVTTEAPRSPADAKEVQDVISARTETATVRAGERQGDAAEVEGDMPEMIRQFGDLPHETVVTERWLAKTFNRCKISIRRAVERGELPPPMNLFGNRSWTVGAILRHWEARQEQAAKEREKMERRLTL